MDNQLPDPSSETPTIRLFGVGDAGLNVLKCSDPGRSVPAPMRCRQHWRRGP